MSIYKFPPAYKGDVFSWDEMTKIPDAYYGSSRAKQDVGSLMYFLGLKENLDMTYGKEGSSADTQYVPRTLKAFGYSSSGCFEDYDITDVIPDLQQGFPVILRGDSYKKNHRILGINIVSTYSGGHCWLAHGVLERGRDILHYNASGQLIKRERQSEWYLLCNWGWGIDYAYLNGYFLSKAFYAANGPTFPEWEQSSRSSDLDGSPNVYKYRIKAVTQIRR